MLNSQYEQTAVIALVGALAYLGRLLYGKTKLSVRNLMGAGLVGSTLGLVAGAALLFFPNIPPIAMAGVAAGLATIGQEIFKAVVEAFVYKTTGKDISETKEEN